MNRINNICLVFILIFSVLSCTKEQLKPMGIAENLISNYEDHSSMSYEIDYKQKYFSQLGDTTKLNAKIDLIREPKDSVLGGFVWIEYDSMDRYYDTEYLYLIKHREKEITRYPKDKIFPISGHTLSETIRMYFLKPDRLKNGLLDSTNTVDLMETNLNGTAYWKWKYAFEKEDGFKNSFKEIWINQKDYSIPKMTYTVDFQSENQYNQWDLRNIIYDKINPKLLKERFARLKDNYKLSDYKERTKEESEPLIKGDSISELVGTFYTDSNNFSLRDYSGKLTLLDFWYMDCFPCIKAIPHLNELYNKYHADGLEVFGVNPFDNRPKSLRRLPIFFKDNPINYPVIFTDREKLKPFKVRGYPTFYLIDKKGVIIDSGIGFGESLMTKMDSLIQVHI